MILIELQPTAPAFQPRQGLQIHVRLRNGGAPAEIPNPAALRASPEWRISPWPPSAGFVTGNQQGYAAPHGQPQRLSLATGTGWDGTVAISSDNADLTPGDWAVSLLLPVDGTVQESPPCRVRIAGWHIDRADAGYGVPNFNRQDGDTLLLQGGIRPKTLYRMPWQENHGDRTGHGGAPPIPLIEVADNATDLLVPVRNGPFYGDGARWLLWREAAHVHAYGEAGQPQSLDLGAPPAALLRPALQRTGEAVVLVALSASRDRLMRLRFPRKNDTPPQVDGELALPIKAAAGTAAFAPAGGELVAVAAEAADGVSLVLVSFADPQPPRRAVFPGVSLIAAPPALLAAENGDVRVSALVRAADGIRLVEAEFRAGAAPPVGTATRPLGAQGVTSVQGALLYHRAHAEGGPPQPAKVAVVLQLGDHSLMTCGDDGLLQPARFAAPPVTPLVLVPGIECPFLLCCDPVHGPFMAEV